MSQLLVDGPTARSVVFLSACDDLNREPAMFFIHGLIDPKSVTEDGHFGMQALHAYDPEFDYGPWIAQCRRQTTAMLIQNTNRELAIASAFGAHFVTHAPFRARLLHRRSGVIDAPNATLWADVPLLPQLAANELVPILRSEDTVEALRREMRRAFRHVDGSDPHQAIDAAADLVEELEYAAGLLEKQIRTEHKWNTVVGGGMTAGSVALAVTQGPFGFASQLLGTTAGLAAMRANARARRQNGAFAFVMAKRRLRRTSARAGVGARR